jgi:hypothetical protein
VGNPLSLVSDQPGLSRRCPCPEGQLGLMLIRGRLLQMRQDPRNHLGLVDAGNHPELAAAADAQIDLDAEDALQALCPRHGHVARADGLIGVGWICLAAHAPTRWRHRRTVFRAQPEAIDARRVAFITTNITASASEAVISALAPYTEVAVIGGRTFGKPVAQDAFDLANCDLRLRPVTYATYNRDGAGEYYSGIPYAGFRGDFCASAENFSSPLGADADPLLATSVAWLAAGDCPASASAAAKEFARPPEAEGKSEFSGLGATY